MNEEKEEAIIDNDEIDEPKWHTCPYAEEIHDDYTTLCNCCPAKTRECAMDI